MTLLKFALPEITFEYISDDFVDPSVEKTTRPPTPLSLTDGALIIGRRWPFAARYPDQESRLDRMDNEGKEGPECLGAWRLGKG